MKPVLQSLTLAAIVFAASLLWVVPNAARLTGIRAGDAKATVAQRYPLRARSNNFYNRSKISYTRGK